MCRAVPRRVLEVQSGRALVDYDGRPTWINLSALEDVERGQYVVVYAGQALEHVPSEEAEEFIAFEAELERLLEQASR